MSQNDHHWFSVALFDARSMLVSSPYVSGHLNSAMLLPGRSRSGGGASNAFHYPLSQHWSGNLRSHCEREHREHGKRSATVIRAILSARGNSLLSLVPSQDCSQTTISATKSACLQIFSPGIQFVFGSSKRDYQAAKLWGFLYPSFQWTLWALQCNSILWSAHNPIISQTFSESRKRSYVETHNLMSGWQYFGFKHCSVPIKLLSFLIFKLQETKRQSPSRV